MRNHNSEITNLRYSFKCNVLTLQLILKFELGDKQRDPAYSRLTPGHGPPLYVAFDCMCLGQEEKRVWRALHEEVKTQDLQGSVLEELQVYPNLLLNIT